MSNPYLQAGQAAGGLPSGNPYLDAGRSTPATAAPPPKSGGGILGAVLHNPVSNVVGNLGKDIASTAVGVGPALALAGKTLVSDATSNPLHPQHQFLDQVLTPIAKQYESYYGHNVFQHLQQHPLQPLLDAATLASGGIGGASKLAKLAAPESGLAKLGERGTIVTRSPRAVATENAGKRVGPVQTELTSVKPQVQLRQQAAAAVRAKFPEGRATVAGKRVPVPGVGGELKRYGKGIQDTATQTALGRLQALPAYEKAVKRLTPDEWTALHIRAIDIHPEDLKTLWKGTPNGAALTPKVSELALNPSKRMLKAEPQLRALSTGGEQLYTGAGKLKEETAAARPGVTKEQASTELGRPVKEITGSPYYIPHQLEPVRGANPLIAGGGGKGPAVKPGSLKQNQGVLALAGKLHLRSDVLGPEFMRRVKYLKYDEIHNALRRGAVRVTRAEIDTRYGGKLPPGWEYLREKPSTVIPPSIRGQGTTEIPVEKLVPNPADLHDSTLGEGFTTAKEAEAHTSGGKFYIVPSSTVKAATGEFTRSSKFVRTFLTRPLSVWRAVILGLRVGFLTNNLVGNSVMYAARTGGTGALRDLFMAIRETHGPQVAKQILDDPATPVALRQDLYREFFPEQMQGTFGRTQSPSTSLTHLAGQKAMEGFRGVTGALPKLTSKVAEEYPRKALIRNAIRRSPEFKQVYHALPKETRSFQTVARQLLEGKGGKPYQRMVSRQVDQVLGNYLHLSPFERNILRNTFPFYSWYRAIAVTTGHLAADTPLRANILSQLGRIGSEWSQQQLGQLPTFLQGAVGLGPGKGGTQKALSTQSMNPYATLSQLLRGSTTDIGSLGLNPLPVGMLQTYGRAAEQQHSYLPHVAPGTLLAQTLQQILTGLPPVRLAQPLPPSKLYPNRDRLSELSTFLGVPIKEYNPAVATQQAQQGR